MIHIFSYILKDPASNFGLISLSALGVLLMFFINWRCDGLGVEKGERFKERARARANDGNICPQLVKETTNPQGTQFNLTNNLN